MSYYLFHTSTVKLIPFCLYIISAIKQWENKVMKFYHATSSLKHPTDLISIKHNYYLNVWCTIKLITYVNTISHAELSCRF